MYFHTDDEVTIDYIARVTSLADALDLRLRIDVDSEGNLRIKRGEGMWSAPVRSTPDPYRDNSVTGMKWFVNEDGYAYEYPAEYQREVYPNDFHTPFDTEVEAEAWMAAQEAPDPDDGIICHECHGLDGSHYLNCSAIWSFKLSGPNH